MSIDRERVMRLLGSASLTALRRRLRARFEQGRTNDEFTLTGLNEQERRALGGLLGRAVKAADSMRVRQSEIDEALSRAGLASDLREALEVLDGPVVNLRAQRRARAEAWSAALANIADPRIRNLVLDPVGSAVLKRFSNSDATRALQLLQLVQRVIARLPERGTPRARLAAETLGDSHALDPGRPIATLVLRACEAGQIREGVERARERWARLGVTVNELARPALVLNVRALDDSYGAHKARLAADRGEPTHLALRDLLRNPPVWDVQGRAVFVCENPEVVAAASDRLSVRCAPLICTDGMPAAAQRALLSQLASHGAQLRYHGDFDWEGIGIGNVVIRMFGAVPWRFAAADYIEGGSELGVPLSGDRIEASWDPGLASAMAERGVLLHEEAVLENLLADLECACVEILTSSQLC